MAEEFVWVEFDLLERFMVDVFKAVGVPEADAAICADILIESDKRGIDSHGIGRFKPIYIDRIKDGILNTKTDFEVIKDGPTTAVADGHNGMGMVVAYKAMRLAIEKARALGMGMVAVRNSTHYGIAGYYASMAIDEGMIGITGTNARPSIAPTFGVENMLGTNPLTIGFPTDEEFPFILDCATSVTQRGKIESWNRLGRELPEGWVIGQDGTSRTDAAQVLKELVAGTAALTPLGGIGEENAGYKGYGYAAVVEVLCAALQDGAYLKDLLGFDEQGRKIPYPLGHFFIAIDAGAFLGVEVFKRVAGAIMRELRSSKRMPGAERIFTAGEKEHEAWLFRKDKGARVDHVLQRQMIELRDEYILPYSFPFEK